jgi:hypothetical protein
MRPTRTAKRTQGLIIWLDFKKTFPGRCVVDDLARCMVDEECGGKEGFIPVLKRHMCMCKKRHPDFHDVPRLVLRLRRPWLE